MILKICRKWLVTLATVTVRFYRKIGHSVVCKLTFQMLQYCLRTKKCRKIILRSFVYRAPESLYSLGSGAWPKWAIINYDQN